MADAEEAHVDVDDVLRQLKQAKDRELRLRAEKERVRKELDALRTGDLWTRETATQRELEAVQTRRRALQAKETDECERLQTLDQELREKEVSIQKQRRSPLDTIKQAAASIVAPASVELASGSFSSKHGLPLKPAVLDDRASQPPVVVPQSAKPRRTEASVQRRRSPGNQDPAHDAVAQLAFSIDLQKQQTRIKRLEQQVEQSRSLQQNGGNVWDLPSPTAWRGSPRIARRERSVEFAAPVVDVEKSRTDAVDDTADSAKEPVSAPKRQTPRTPQMQVPTQFGPQLTQMPHEPSGPVHSTGGWPYQPYTLSHLPMADPRFVYPHTSLPIGAPPTLTGSNLTGYLSPTMVAPAYSLFTPPTVVPMIAPSVYSPWSFTPPFGQPNYGYSPPEFAQLPPIAHAAPFLSQPSPPFVTPPVDQDVVRLQSELDLLRKKDQENDDEKEFTKVQELLTGLQQQVTQLTRTRSGDVSTSEVAGDTPRTSAIAEAKDPGLTSIKRQHLEAVLKVRNERDLLEEQDKLEEVQERVGKRREERKRDMDREALIAKQKQELMTLRLQRAVAKMDAKRPGGAGLIPDVATSNRSYDPDAGVLLCWDFASGLQASTENVQLTFAVYDGKIPRSPIKVLASRECESEGPTHKRAIFATNRLVKPLPASETAVVIVEVSNVTTTKGDSGKPTLRRLGWAAYELFKRGHSASSGELQLASGWLRTKLSPTSMPDPTAVLVRGLVPTDSTANNCADVVLHFRIANGELEEQARNAVVDPDVHAGRYQEPNASQQTDVPTAQPSSEKKASALDVPLVQSPSSPSNRSNKRLAVTTEVARAVLHAKAPEQKPPVDLPPPSRDFLDIERLCLLSSSSVTPRPSTELVRPRSTLSAVPRHRVGAGAGSSLAAVPEASHFDDTSSTSPWIRVDKSVERHRRLARQLFQPGDGFDVYIDGARFLPDNVAVTKITIAALNGDRSKVFPTIPEANSQVAAAGSDACSPSFNLYVEYREKAFDPTLTLVIRVDTFDTRLKQPVILAYALFAVFLDADSHAQPTRSNGTQFGLNEGAFQLPLYVNAAVNDPASGPLNAASAVASVPKLPCATLLIRVRLAMTSEDGLQVLSRGTVHPNEWAAQGLDEPAPPYESGDYDSMASIPTPLEMKMYYLRDKKPSTSVQQTLNLLGPSPSPADTSFPAKPLSFMDLRFAYRYQPAIGFRISIDGLYNLKVKAGGFCRVVYSVAPPGAFYQSIRLTSGVHFTTTTDWSSLPTSPEFQDGFVPLRDIPADPRLVVVVDVRVITKSPKTNVYQSQPLAWSFVPVLDDRTGSVAAGSFQIPLFTGEVKLAALDSSSGLSTLMEDIAAEKKKLLLPFMDGASVFVRLEDPQVPTTTPSQPMTGAVISSMMPVKSLARYQYDVAKVALVKKKTPLSKQIPPGVSEKQLDAEINQAFATEMGIHHY